MASNATHVQLVLAEPVQVVRVAQVRVQAVARHTPARRHVVMVRTVRVLRTQLLVVRCAAALASVQVLLVVRTTVRVPVQRLDQAQALARVPPVPTAHVGLLYLPSNF